MQEEKRTESVNFKVRPSVKEAIKVDRIEKGQSITVWLERAIMAALEPKEVCKDA